LKRDNGLRATLMSYEAFNRDAAFLAKANTLQLAKALALACRNPAGNTLQRQLVAAGLKNMKGAILEECSHWLYEENPSETLSVISNFLGAANAVP
jgi:hypothetical protein